MKELLLEQKGKRTKALTVKFVCAFLLVILDVILFFLSGAHYDTGPSVNGYVLPGAGDSILTEKPQLPLKFMGIDVVVIGIFSLIQFAE